MPTIKMMDSVKIDVYSRDHLPPHFHAIYAEYEELIEIETLKTYIGKLPAVQRKKVMDWAKENKEYRMGIFKQLNPR
ncbi:MAG TPA: DUF4160 domain-containing protein [Prolixibacteraceae bacterium]|jgi:hypothetical protein|nr:DUF4160 domain-containing protein [Prolixibacteraceae bacterium]